MNSKVKISQSDFDALTVKGINTYYVIKGKNIIYKGKSLNPINKQVTPAALEWEFPISAQPEIKIFQAYNITKNNTTLEIE